MVSLVKRHVGQSEGARVVEDDDIIADMMANALREFGYEVTVAENGRAAFALTARSVWTY